ncbi:hypothetical protein [Vreelandella malpeensis]|uniref:Uncharacterized protein n=1 Tax=Vreelandella malpeensis TaxID=1172368 RepID=A0ABS8DTP8_9GAMM|nr:hypothetical protein [Halomonas malpeensis]MCB8889643.1 hypothetical protein [Halomonas malpeensis]
MRSARILLALAVGLAGLLTALASTEAFEPRLVRLETQRALPSLDAALAGESAEINAVFLHYADEPALWMNAHLALERFGGAARETLLSYAYLPAFQDVLARFGPEALLPIVYYREHDVATLKASRWWNEADDTPLAPVEWNANQRGLMGIALLADEGHALLNQFAVDSDNEIHWLQSERVITGVGDFFTSGVRGLESRWRRDEAIGAADMGWAGVDLLLMASTVKVLRAGRLARGARVGGVEARATQTGARSGALAGTARFAALPRAARLAALTATAYVVIRHPSLISALGANLARWLGLPAWLGQFALWLVVLLPALIMLRVLWRFVLAPLSWAVALLLRHSKRPIE